MNHTEVWVVFTSAFGGGFLGAVLQILISHLLENVRSDRFFRKKRQQELRRMLRTYMTNGRKLMAIAQNAALMEEMRRPTPLLDRLMKIQEATQGEYLWEPYSIRDNDLRELAEAYGSEVAGLWRETTEEHVDPARTYRRVGTLEDLQRRITRRMDDLVWPVGE